MQAAGSTSPGANVTATQASKMLEEALQQMDGIISNATTNNNSNNTSGNNKNNSNVIEVDSAASVDTTSTHSSVNIALAVGNNDDGNETANDAKSAHITNLCKELAFAIKEFKGDLPCPADMVSASIILDWLERYIPTHRVQRDKENLAMQYHVLVERVNEQADKIIQLESLLTERTQQLSAKEDMLQRQLLTASALETQKFEFMSAISELKLHRAALGREAAELSSAHNNNNNNNINNNNNNNMLIGSAGNLQNIYNDERDNETSKANNTLRYRVKLQKNQPQFHSLPRMRVAKNTNNNNSNNNSSVWQEQTNENNNNNNNENDNDCSCISVQQQKRNVAFASHEKIIDDLIDDNDDETQLQQEKQQDQQDQDAQQGNMLQNYLQQTAAVAAAKQQHNNNQINISNNNNNNTDVRLTLQQQTPSPTLRERSTKSLRQIFGKLRRSNSGNLELPALEQNDLEFKRGGARATAGGRIEWATTVANAPNKAWADWSPQEICNWLADLGLACYEDDCRKWLKNNNVDFFTASPVDIERELNIKMPLHRKKLMFAMDELTLRETDALALSAARLDVGWVLRWLDDIGLPQYKDNFLQAKVDGRMLHRLTIDDLMQLHVNSCLHIASLRSGIQIMRKMHWNPSCLIRRSLGKPNALLNAANGQGKDEIMDMIEREAVELWTAHRVMEWLRVVDLSEYAPNLRGAGVHGALMFYEARFNANLLADLLSIPPSKTLLRRHLATHFKELLGREVITAKRYAESANGYQALTITAKLKPPKKNSQFSLKRRKSTKAVDAAANSPNSTNAASGGVNVDTTITGDIEWSSYVCPMSRTTTT